MRKYIRDRLLELLSTILNGVKYIKNNKNNAEVVLADCYAAVNAICEALGSGLSVERFAQYNDCLNGLKILLESLRESISGELPTSKIINRISDQLRLLKKELENESEIKLEIVFMPYNANMWDSLESIWLAAKNDNSCVAYVVPVPYYNKTPGGSFGELKYDGNNFPNYVPIIHYNSYNLSIRKPDIIYVHNPYDQYNYVTTVDPRFYSHELKKHTDMLVYVPYFVLGEAFNDSFCYTSGAMHADKIIVQSESVRRSYVKFVKESKVIALGSPKIDKVVNTKREDQALPEQWGKTIQNKKVVFYNTHLNNLFANGSNNHFIDKLKNVFSVFEGRDDVLLWWRPHPLSMATLSSMNPRFMRDYLAIVEEYKSKNIGIYDDTNDLHRAISLADAYYGDPSSVLLLLGVTGKPALLQDATLKAPNTDKNELKIAFRDFAVKDNAVWFVPYNINGLFSMDLDTEKFRFIGEIPSERAFASNLVASVTACDDYIVLTPFNGKNIVRYDTRNESFELAAIKESGVGSKFFSSYLYDDCVYMMPFSRKSAMPVIKYDVKKNSVTKNSKLTGDLNRINTDESFYFFGDGVINDDNLTAASPVGNTVVRYNMKSDKHSIYHIGDTQNSYICVAYASRNYWLFPKRGGIVKWNDKTGTMEVLDNYPDSFTESPEKMGYKFNFKGAVIFENSIFVFPNNSNLILEINAESNEIKEFANLLERENITSKDSRIPKYACAKRINDYIYASSFYEMSFQRINPKTGEIHNIPFILSDEDYAKVVGRSLFNAPPNIKAKPYQDSENPIVTLELFLDRLMSEDITKENISFKYVNRIFSNTDGSCGKKTHDYITQLVKNRH